MKSARQYPLQSYTVPNWHRFSGELLDKAFGNAWFLIRNYWETCLCLLEQRNGGNWPRCGWAQKSNQTWGRTGGKQLRTLLLRWPQITAPRNPFPSSQATWNRQRQIQNWKVKWSKVECEIHDRTNEQSPAGCSHCNEYMCFARCQTFGYRQRALWLSTVRSLPTNRTQPQLNVDLSSPKHTDSHKEKGAAQDPPQSPHCFLSCKPFFTFNFFDNLSKRRK